MGIQALFLVSGGCILTAKSVQRVWLTQTNVPAGTSRHELYLAWRFKLDGPRHVSVETHAAISHVRVHHCLVFTNAIRSMSSASADCVETLRAGHTTHDTWCWLGHAHDQLAVGNIVCHRPQV